jgi:8-oxo-dGTP pyrophosphatase MutT (NUDIX family)
MVIDTLTVPWIPVPHRMEVMVCAGVPPGYTVTSAFALVRDAAGRTLLTHVDRPGRGWEVPGGHVNPGESPAATAARELAEETGLSVPPERLAFLGGLRITLLAVPPPDYRYPSRAFLAFFAHRLDGPGGPTSPHPESECDQAQWADDPADRCLGAPWLALAGR